MTRDAHPPLRRLVPPPEGEVRALRALLTPDPVDVWLLDVERLDADARRELDAGQVPAPLRAWWLAAASGGARLASFARSRWGRVTVTLGPADPGHLDEALDGWAFTGAHALVWGASEATVPLRCERALAPCVDGCGIAVLGDRAGWEVGPLG